MGGRFLSGAALITTVLVVLVLGPWSRTQAWSAAPARMIVSPATAAVGQTVQVVATGLSPQGGYDLEVCGQNAVDGSSDCAVAGTVTTTAGADGALNMPLQVAVPPTQCPCVIAAFPTTSNASPVTAPISIEGVGTSTATIPPPQTPRPNIVVVDAKMGSLPFGAWFGLPSTQTLVLTLRNTGTEPAGSLHFFATLGSTPVVSRQLLGPGIGQEETYTVPVSFPALSVGNLSLSANVDRGNGQLNTFKVPSPHWPWGLFIVAFFIVQAILLTIRNRMRRRHERKSPPPPTPVSPDEPMFAGEEVRHGG
jgi:hypothetical protein